MQNYLNSLEPTSNVTPVVSDAQVPITYATSTGAGELNIHRVELAGVVFAQLDFDMLLPPLSETTPSNAFSWPATPELTDLGNPKTVCFHFTDIANMRAIYFCRFDLNSDGSATGNIGLDDSGQISDGGNARTSITLIW